MLDTQISDIRREYFISSS